MSRGVLHELNKGPIFRLLLWSSSINFSVIWGSWNPEMSWFAIKCHTYQLASPHVQIFRGFWMRSRWNKHVSFLKASLGFSGVGNVNSSVKTQANVVDWCKPTFEVEMMILFTLACRVQMEQSFYTIRWLHYPWARSKQSDKRLIGSWVNSGAE